MTLCIWFFSLNIHFFFFFKDAFMLQHELVSFLFMAK